MTRRPQTKGPYTYVEYKNNNNLFVFGINEAFYKKNETLNIVLTIYIH